jgi:HEPN domain-containing protein
MKERAYAFFNEAIKKVNEANEELCRPEEDVVTYSVCKNAQFAIENYLRGFLLNNDVDPSSCNTIDSLYNECKTINKKFEEIDLTDFSCKSHEIGSKYCNQVTKVSNCFNIADNLDTFFRREKIIS